MKTKIILFLLVLGSFSCNDDDDETTLSSVLQGIIQRNNITALVPCVANSFCSDESHGDYEFIGDSNLRVDNEFFDLNELDSYEVERSNGILVMNLYFRS
ncbi:MAG: hypothetical protein R8G66_15565 [Cytophagales bacterium]|nr:hypothetical protein [Cytophagales bacterium]